MLRPFFILVVLILAGCANHRYPSNESSQSPDYPKIFAQAREALKLENQSQRRSKSDPAETAVIQVLQESPDKLAASKTELLKSIQEESTATTDLTKHLRLIPPAGEPGYQNLAYYSSHPYYFGNKKQQVAATNLVDVWASFLNQAERQIILNVFDFDLKTIADLLVRKSQSGIQVEVGIDKGTITHRPEVKAVYERLVQSGIRVTQVDSVSLNHQKIAAIDWDDIKKAKVLFSSGNLTQSCLGPEGDLVQIPKENRPKESIPNANHVMTMDSWLAANLVYHELKKTFDNLYRGSQYPTVGSYQITGPGVDPHTLDPYPEKSFVITFSPGGGYRNINQNVIAHFIRKSDGPIRMTQFAYSSEEVATALRERAARDFQKTGKFDFQSVGDTPFALQYWSQFLKMSGLDLQIEPNKKTYLEKSENEWVKSLSPLQLQTLRKSVRIAPAVYGNHNIKVNGQALPVSAKIHHKILVTGPFAIVGTSFNFSEGAETNNEQILVFKDKALVQFATGMTEWLFQRSPRSVYEEAQRRNKNQKISDGDTGSDDQAEVRAAPQN